MSTGKKPVFVLGVGAQKAGTSWLHHYLSGRSETDFGFMKEYHVFDQRHVPDTRPKPLSRTLEYVTSFIPRDEAGLRARFRRNHRNYFTYFKSLVEPDREAFVTGDITPSYAALPAETFLEIKKNLEKHGFQVRVIFLMRDPVERCISANRMYAKKSLLREPNNLELEALLLSTKYRTKRFEIRTRYDHTLKTLDRAFRPEEVYIGFYEELFQDSTVAQICNFVGLDFEQANYEYIANGAKIKNEIPPQLKLEIRNHYSGVYDYVADRFGPEKVKSLWRNF